MLHTHLISLNFLLGLTRYKQILRRLVATALRLQILRFGLMLRLDFLITCDWQLLDYSLRRRLRQRPRHVRVFCQCGCHCGGDAALLFGLDCFFLHGHAIQMLSARRLTRSPFF